jgi:hypothetical protein
MKRLFLLLLSALFVAACGGGVAPTPTGGQPTAGQPTQTAAQPTPADTGEEPDGETLPPDPSSGACRLLTPQEVATAMGEATVTVTSATSNDCTYSAGIGIPSVSIRFNSGETLDAARMILEEPEDITIAGNPAVFGEFMGSLLYVQEGGNVLVFQALWDKERAEAKTTLTALAEAALPRFPLP